MYAASYLSNAVARIFLAFAFASSGGTSTVSTVVARAVALLQLFWLDPRSHIVQGCGFPYLLAKDLVKAAVQLVRHDDLLGGSMSRKELMQPKVSNWVVKNHLDTVGGELCCRM